MAGAADPEGPPRAQPAAGGGGPSPRSQRPSSTMSATDSHGSSVLVSPTDLHDPSDAPSTTRAQPPSPRPPTPSKTLSATGRRMSVNVVADNVFFVFGGVAAIWLAWIILTESFSWGWFLLVFFIVFWIVLAYLVLPRLHRILTQIYVPDYFIGRARTSDGLLGDPINLALLGSEAQLDEAMIQAGWTRADDVTAASSRRIITSTLLRRSYDEAPVSPLFLFGHQQDIAYQQEVKGNPAKRHHVRFWRCPEGWLLPGGHRVDWLAAGTFDRSVGFSLFTLQVTHKIDANTDIERDHIVSTLVGADIGAEVAVIRDFSSGYHARNGGGDAIETDGDLPVVDLSTVHVDPRAVAVAAGADQRRLARAEHRPVPTTLGFLLMLLRVLAGVLTVVLTVLAWPLFIRAELLSETGKALTASEQQSADLVFGIAMGLFAAGLVFYFAIALLVFSGSNWARIVAMSYSALLIILAAVDFFNGGQQVTLRTNILGLPLDILVVLALSSQRARLWARRSRLRTRRDTSPGAGSAGSATTAHDPDARETVALAAVDAPADDTTVG